MRYAVLMLVWSAFMGAWDAYGDAFQVEQVTPQDASLVPQLGSLPAQKQQAMLGEQGVRELPSSEHTDALRAQVMRCWPAFETDKDTPYKDPGVPFVTDIEVDKSGRVLSMAPHDVAPREMPAVEIIAIYDVKGNPVGYDMDDDSKASFRQYPAYRSFAYRAVDTVKNCQLKTLPVPVDKKQHGWVIGLIFIPTMQGMPPQLEFAEKHAPL